jgi:N-acyl-D-amino-acid deacylase
MAASYDILLRGGRVFDGAGNPWQKIDVGIQKGAIAAVGRIDPASASTVIDCNNLAVCPGFIDMHSHSDIMIFREPEASTRVMQGVTTEVIGQDGISVAPIKDDDKREWQKHLSGLTGDIDTEWNWNTFDEYLSVLEKSGTTTNIISLVPHGSIRLWVMGMENRAAHEKELTEMQNILAESLEAGAVGMSTGLIYPPCPYADVSELVALSTVLHDHGKFFVAHMRSEDAEFLEATDEMIAVARGSGAPVHISHLKAMGKPRFGRSPELLEKIDGARREGLDLTFDQYPYTAGSTMLFAMLPQWLQEGGSDKMIERLKDAEIRKRILEEMASSVSSSGIELTDIRVSSVGSERNRHLEGKNIIELSEAVGKELIDAVCDLLVEEELNVAMVIFVADEGDIRRILQHPAGTVCTDGLLGGKPHPRVYGTFPRVLGKYCREEKVLPLPEAIRRMTSAGAQRLGLSDRGLIRGGMKADIVVFNPETVIDNATYENPRQFPTGIEHVIINGNHVVEKGKQVGKGSGMVLRV